MNRRNAWLPAISRRSSVLLAALFAIASTAAMPAAAQPFFSKEFVPSTVAVGTHSRLVFTIDNSEIATPATALAFTDVLPAGVVLATPPSATTTCGASATISAPDGGTTIAFSGGDLPADQACEVAVDVVGDGAGQYLNTSGDLTSSAGNSGPATATLTIAEGRMHFSKAFATDSVQVGSDTTLAFTLGPPGGQQFVVASFSDTLPSGLVIADPSNASTTCSGTLSAPAGGATISLQGAFFSEPVACTVTVDVTATAAGTLVNRSDSLTTNAGPSGFAVDALVATIDALALEKEFLGDPLPPGSTLPLRFTLRNVNRAAIASGLTFSDDLDAALTGLAAVAPLPVDPCGTGSALSGTSELTLTGGTLGPDESCSFEVQVEIPAAAEPGSYPNTTSSITGDVGGVAQVGAAATDTLEVQEVPLLTKTFLDDPVAAGDAVVLEFTLGNSSSDVLEGAGFGDDVVARFGGGSVAGLPAPGYCGAGSSASATPGGVQFSGMTLAGGADCTFQVTVQLAASMPRGTYTNTTSQVSGTLGGTQPVLGPAASDTLTVVGGPVLTKEFLVNPVLPGDTVDLQFTLSTGAESASPVADVAFTDDLDAVLAGLQAIALPADGFCGAGSTISGTSVLSVSGASLAGGASCTFALTVQVPADALPGNYLNTTSAVTGSSEGLAVTGAGAVATLQVGGLTFEKAFIDSPVVAGGTATLQFTLANLDADDALTDAAFSDDLDAVIPGLTVAGALPTDPCGAGSTLALVGSVLQLAGGNLTTAGTAGDACTFEVGLAVPAAATPSEYANTTSPLQANLGGQPVTLPPATADVTVIAPLSFAKEFIDDPVAPGSTVTLQFTLANAHPTQAATGLTFTDDLDAALAGLVATGLPQADACGAGSILSGTSVLTLTGGSLAAAASCQFQVALQVPADAPAGAFLNTTGALTGTLDGAGVSAPPASAALTLSSVVLAKSFGAATGAGATVELDFTLSNLGSVAVDGLAFTDDLDAVLPGLAAVGLPMADVCGPGSQIAGDSVLVFSGGSLDAGATCAFTVTLQMPAGAAPGAYVNVTSGLTSSGLPVGGAAQAGLAVEPAPLFAKAFSPAAITAGEVSTLVFTIDNSAAAADATELAFTDALPAGLVVAAAPNAAATCTGGSLAAAAGAGSIGYSGGTVAAGATCTVQVDVSISLAGAHDNVSGALTSSLGDSGTASATLQVADPPPLFAKAFAPATITAGGVTTLTFTIDNSAAMVTATALSFTDNLPAGLLVAAVPQAASTCTGGSLSALAGSGVIGFSGGTVAAGATCTVQVDVSAAAGGSYLNTSAPLTSSLGSSGTASATLQVGEPVPLFAKAFAPSVVATGAVATVTFTIDNSASAVEATALAFSDTLPAGLLVAAVPNAATTCTGGTLVAAADSGSIAYSGGTVAAGASCTVQVDVSAAGPGIYVNSSGLTSSLGDSGSASASLEVVDSAPLFGKAFSPAAIVAGEVARLTFTIDNSVAITAATALAFTDTLPAGLQVAPTPNPSSSCTGGTLVAEAASGSIAYSGGSVAAGATCTLAVDVSAPFPGNYENLSEPLTSSLGTSGSASATLQVTAASVQQIPALGQWMLLALGLLLAGFAWRRLA